MTKKPKKNGRHRSDNKVGIVGAKKKPEEKKVRAVQFYVESGHIEAIGGIVEARRIGKEAVENTKPIKKKP